MRDIIMCGIPWAQVHVAPRIAQAVITSPWQHNVCVGCLIYSFQVAKAMNLMLAAHEIAVDEVILTGKELRDES